MKGSAHRMFVKRTSNAFHSHKKQAREAGVEPDLVGREWVRVAAAASQNGMV